LLREKSEEGSAALMEAIVSILLIAATRHVDWEEVSKFFSTDSNTTTGSH
jgi:hypothetical protein